MPYFPSWQVKLPHPLDRRPSQVSTDSNWPQFGESSKDFEQVDESQSPVVSTSSRDSRYFPQHPARDYDDPEDRRLLREALLDIYEQQKWQRRSSTNN